MADKKEPAESTTFQIGQDGSSVSAEPELAQALQSGGSRPTDSRRSTEVGDTVDDLGIARVNAFERQFAGKRGGGRIAGSDALRGDADRGDEVSSSTTGTVGVRNAEEVVTTTGDAAPVADKPRRARG